MDAISPFRISSVPSVLSVVKMLMRLRPFALTLALGSAAGASPAGAQQVPEAAYSQLSWRMIGPFRGGRTVAAVGAPGRPATLYIGVNNGGVWRSTDYGRVWQPIFDEQ